MFFKRKETVELDTDGQPKVNYFAKSRLIDRNIDELIGICKGVMFDGAVSANEAEMMLLWLETNKHAAHKWPANVLYNRLENALKDGVIDDEEERDILKLLVDITGSPKINNSDYHSASTTLPIDQPEPSIVFPDKNFCITGKFLSGPRNEIVREIENRGGFAIKSPTKKTDYLVIGEVGSRDWIHSTFGRKIEKAIEYKELGISISIITEEHLLRHFI